MTTTQHGYIFVAKAATHRISLIHFAEHLLFQQVLVTVTDRKIDGDHDIGFFCV